MKTKMSVLVTLKGPIESKELYEDIKKYGANVTDMGNKVMVYVVIDIRENAIEHILAACHKYDNDCQVNAQIINKEEKPSD